MVRVAVIGAGYLGRFHIEKFKKINSVNLVCVCEVDKKIAQSISKDFDVPIVSDYKSLAGKVDAVSIVTPTPTHYEIADFFLENKIHLFIEKPVTDNIESARKLLKKRKKGLVVQIGYIERYNPAFKILKENLCNPKTIIFKRKAPFSLRGSDVDVIFDLMIHDIDLAFNIFESKPKVLSVVGKSIFSNFNDIVYSVFNFGDTLAIFEISRVSDIKERKITALTDDTFVESDLINQSCRIIKKKEEKVISEEKKDILLEELSDFINAIEKGQNPKVTLEDGIESLDFAHKILERIRK